MPTTGAANELEPAFRWIDAAFQGDPIDVRNWPVLLPLEPHGLAIAGFAKAAGIGELTARLFSRMGLLLHGMAGGIQLNNLAQLLKASSCLVEAEPLMGDSIGILQAMGLPESETPTIFQSLPASKQGESTERKT